MKTQIDSVVRRGGSVLAALAFAFVATSAHAASVNFASAGSAISVNGGPNCRLNGPAGATCGSSQLFYTFTSGNQQGYDFMYSGWNSATTTGALDTPGDSVILGTAGTGVGHNGTGASNPTYTTSAFLALDSDYPNFSNGIYTGGPALLDISGLLQGYTYTITFDTADAQQQGPQYVGPTHDAVEVCLSSQGTFTGSGNNCGTTQDVVDTLTGGSTGWVAQSFTFQANVTGTETLGFLGIGPTNNVPAFALVDNLSITQNPAPEPSSLMLLGTGLAGLGGLVRSRFTKRG